MKNNFLPFIALLTVASVSVSAQELGSAHSTYPDSLRTYKLDEVVITSTRATETTPIAYTNVGKEQLKKVNNGQDLPYLLSMTPSAITTSDAGAGIGYTTLRVRGTDGTRINVTANGIPINDAESHNVFWVNMPDLASSVKDIQVQRGAGTSTNGAGAFGASINMVTTDYSTEPYAEFAGSYGSFNTHKETVKVGTGLFNNHWSFDARLSNIGTDGYLDRATVDLNSFYLQGGYYNGGTTLRLISFGGKERTYHAWNYPGKEEMALYGRTYNSCGYMYTDEKGVDHFYKDQTDNYTQMHYQLLWDQVFTNQLDLNVGLHYTKGDGYYQEYKRKAYLESYGLETSDDIYRSDLVRKKDMDNWLGGAIFSLNYHTEKLSASLGGGLNKYNGLHFGNVLWVKTPAGANLDAEHEYYRNEANKVDGNIYAKMDYSFSSALNGYVDLQYRHIDYKIKGANDNYNWDAGAMQNLDLHEKFNFFNPKLGINYHLKNHRIFASWSVAHKEPTRNNYTDGYFTELPKAERMFDYELGYNYLSSVFSAGANLYFMDYKNQLVLTGELNEIGEAVSNNVPDSYRAGVELMAALKLPFGFGWDVNATFSKNRIKNFTERLYTEDGKHYIDINQGNTHIAFSPDLIFNNRFSYTYKGFEASLQSQYVSKQYMSNANIEAETMDSYFVSNLDLSYTFKLPHIKRATLGVTIYNLFNEEYENNGWAAANYLGTADNYTRISYTGYAAQAGTNFLAHLSLSF